MDDEIDEKKLKRLRNKVKALQKKPQPQQRTPEWFKARNTRITASEAASCLFKSKKCCEEYVKQFNIQNFKYKDTEPLNHYETREEYIIKKCAGFYGVNVFKDSVYTLWGKKYEEVANILYCQLNNTTVIEFGLVEHSRLKWLAASPDGITPDGIMLEIKCPKSRKIDETQVPIHYWIQTQIQMESIDLDMCDFFECEIEELQSELEFVNKIIGDKQSKGILLEILNTGPDPKFIYPPINVKTTDEYINWKNEQMSLRQDLIPTYYFVSKYNNQRVKRSKEWFNNNKEDLKKTWKLITNLQSSKEEFEKYKDSIHLIKSKAFLERYHKTECEISDDSTFIFETKDMKISDNDIDIDIDVDINNVDNVNNNIDNVDNGNNVCLID